MSIKNESYTNPCKGNILNLNPAEGLLKIFISKDYESFFGVHKQPESPICSGDVGKFFERNEAIRRWSYDEYDLFFQIFIFNKIYRSQEEQHITANNIFIILKQWFVDWHRTAEEIAMVMSSFDSLSKSCLMYFISHKDQSPWEHICGTLFVQEWFVYEFFHAMNDHANFSELMENSFLTSFDWLTSINKRKRNHTSLSENDDAVNVKKMCKETEIESNDDENDEETLSFTTNESNSDYF